MGIESEKPIEILIVEDDPGDAALISQALEHSQRPIHSKVVNDGELILTYLRQRDLSSREPLPDLILLDLGLPKKSGWTILSEIKEDPRLKKIPVLILTGSMSDEDERKACFSLADDYILKPKDLPHFATLLNYLEENWLKTIRPHKLSTL